MRMSQRLIIGAHVSAAGGPANAVANAKTIGADAIQIFGSSPRQWKVSVPSAESVAAYRKAYEASGLGPTVLHAPYLANLASPDETLRKKSIQLLAGNLLIAEKLGALGLIFHLGSGRVKLGSIQGSIENAPRETSVGHLVDGVHAILKAAPGKALLMLENSAGGGDKLGNTIAEIGTIMAKAKSPRVALCFDTAHAFEAGVIHEYTPATIKKLATEIKATIGWERLAAVHVNDSKTPWNSHHDRHENIGKGFMGLGAFRALVGSPFATVPWYLEVPGFAGEGPDRKNVNILRGLISNI